MGRYFKRRRISTVVLTTSGWSARTGVPKADTNWPIVGTRASVGARSAARPPWWPNHSWLVVPSSDGRCGGTPAWDRTGREPSQRDITRLRRRSSTSRFHDGPSRLHAAGVADRRLLRGNGSSWAHHTATDGRWPSRSTASRACRRASPTTLRLITPLTGRSCQTSIPSSSAVS